MPEIIKARKMTRILWTVSLGLLFAILIGCKAPEKTATIGIACNIGDNGADVFNGFEEAMAELGYIEGKNIRYIYNITYDSDKEKIDAIIKELMNQDIDLLLIIGGEMESRVKELVKGNDPPVLFVGNPSPVESGLVKTLRHPGGNITGVRVVDCTSKALEWLKMSVPGLKKVYVPYNPDDEMSTDLLSVLKNASSQLEIEPVFNKVHSVEEAVIAIENLPKDIDAVYFLPSPTLNPRNSEIIQAAIKRGMPTGAPLELDDAVMVRLNGDFFDAGKKAARLAQQILKGVKPADLPVETSEVLLIINLKTAEKIGIHVADDVLAQAKTIIR